MQPPALTIVGEVVRLRERIGWFERRRRILVLTSKEDDGPGRDDVDVVRVSPLQIVPRFADVKQALARSTHAKTIAFASAHAVDAFFGALANAGRTRARSTASRSPRSAAPPPRAWPRAASPPTTWATAAAPISPPRSSPAAPWARRSSSAPHDGRRELADALAGAGWAVEPVAAYDSVPDDGALAAAWKAHRARPFDAVAFTSPKGAHAFLALARQRHGPARRAHRRHRRDHARRARRRRARRRRRGPHARRGRARDFARGAHQIE